MHHGHGQLILTHLEVSILELMEDDGKEQGVDRVTAICESRERSNIRNLGFERDFAGILYTGFNEN
ncbi:hypothetical protein PHLCEN_2v5239 [Hermanssonia centrifuga]|uniref:Uncharacterized protein n=1 Tax=Hermanssonia centrifuga TaxID=98765 RepID=A0A2R6P8M3_9APHY|nr:hypothetical protein PHLCEN_2v5239 [Hermanssonia centrifuga]